MKLIIIAVIIAFVVPPERIAADCSDAYSAADEAYDYSKKAQHAESWEDTGIYLRRARDSFDDAMTYAEECGCDDGYAAADEGYEHARRGLQADSWREARQYASRARNSAEEAMNSLSDCDE